MLDRRSERSSRKPEALRLFLEAQRRRLGVPALAVVTARGRLLGGAGSEPTRLARRAAGGDESIGTWRLRAGDRDVLIASPGGRLDHDVGSGVRRILG